MRTQAPVPPLPDLFSPHPNLSDAINRNIIRSEVEGGVYLADLPPESGLEIATQNHFYTVQKRGQEEAEMWISGHPDFCPAPVPVRILGSNWGGSMLKVAFIGRGMRLEFRHPDYRVPIVTSRIREIREIRPEPHRRAAPMRVQQVSF